MVLSDGVDYVWLFVLAAAMGAIGGFTYELLLTVRGRTGAIEKPGKLGPRHLDLGVIASVIIGAVAAVAALWVFPPELATTVAADGTSVTTSSYDLVKVVGLSLIVGSAGGSFLSAMQARALALVKSEQAETTKRVADEQLRGIEQQIAGGAASTQELATSVAGARNAIRATASSGAGNPDVEDL